MGMSQIVTSRKTVRNREALKAVLGFQIQSWQRVLFISTVSCSRYGGTVTEIFFIDWGCTSRKV